MSRFSHYESCPKCREIGRDNRGDNLGVYADGSKHCWSCGYHRFPSHWVAPERGRGVDIDETMLPADFTREVPARAWKWLLQYGLGFSYWKPFVGWSEKDSRLVFTVGNPTQFSIGRFIPSEEGTTSTRKWFVWGESHTRAHVYGDYRQSKTVVLVEDLISAHKIGQIQSCIPLFGTKVFDACIPVLRHIGLPVTIWLDADQQGTIQKKASNLSLITGLPVSYRFTKDDPKSLSLENIKKELNVSSEEV